MSKVIVAPSILAADIGELSREVRAVEAAGADWIHIDVMDGSFVPPITFGENVVRSLKTQTRLFLDTHLMVREPERHVDPFVKAGADRLIVHAEVSPHLHRTLTYIRSTGIKNGVAINPGTPVESIFDILDICDLVLIMTVNPGWGGQPFLSSCLRKVQDVKETIDRAKLSTLVEVDGGINGETARQCVQAGANVLVAGTAIFGAADKKKAIAGLRS